MQLLRFKIIRAKILSSILFIVFLIAMFNTYNHASYNTILSLSKQIKNDELPLLVASEKLASSIDIGLSDAKSYIMKGNQQDQERFNEYIKNELYMIQIQLYK